MSSEEDEVEGGPCHTVTAEDMIEIRRRMCGGDVLKLVNHYLISYGTPYSAELVVNDTSLVCVTKDVSEGQSTECYNAEELLKSLERCSSTEDVRVVLEESGLAL
jgi:hypothetical protein